MTSRRRVLQGFCMLSAPSPVYPDGVVRLPSGGSAQPLALFVLTYSEPNEPFPAPLGDRDSHIHSLTPRSRRLVSTKRSGEGRAGFESVPASRTTGESVDGISPRSKAFF